MNTQPEMTNDNIVPSSFPIRSDVPVPGDDLTQEFDGVYKRLADVVSVDQVKDVLRKLKEDKPDETRGDIHLGKDKQETLGFLRRAVTRGLLAPEIPHQLLHSHEEFGQQHLFMLIPKKTKGALVSDPDKVSQLLFGGPPDSLGFPRFDDPVSSYQWVDFRVGTDGSWTAKMYGHEVRRTGYGDPIESTETIDGQTIFVTTRKQIVKSCRTVLTAHWNPKRFLEIRIDNRNLPGRDGIFDRLNEIVRPMQPIVNESEMKGFPIEQVLLKIVKNRQIGHASPDYRVGCVELEDPTSGMVKVLPTAAFLDDHPGRSATLQTAMEEGMIPDMVEVQWLKTDRSPDTMPSQLTTRIKKTRRGPRVSIKSKASPEEVNYVLDRIFELRSNED